MSQDDNSNTSQYVIAVVVVLLVGIVAYLVIIAQRPQWDKLMVVGSLVASLGPMSWSLLSFMMARQSREQSKETYRQVNSRMDDFKENLQAESIRQIHTAFQDGLAEGENREKRRAAAAAGIP